MNQELDSYNSRKTRLEDELAVSQVKREAVILHEQLAQAEAKRDKLAEEARQSAEAARAAAAAAREAAEERTAGCGAWHLGRATATARRHGRDTDISAQVCSALWQKQQCRPRRTGSGLASE